MVGACWGRGADGETVQGTEGSRRQPACNREPLKCFEQECDDQLKAIESTVTARLHFPEG